MLFWGLRCGFALRRLLPSVVELRSKDLVVVSQLADFLGPPLRPAALRRYVSQLASLLGPAPASWLGLAFGHCCTSLGQTSPPFLWPNP